MWFYHKRPPGASAPSRREKWVLRSLILLGLASVVFFGREILRPEHRGEPWLFNLLIFSFAYAILRILWEWYHYWKLSVPPSPPDPVGEKMSVDVLTTYVPGEPKAMVLDTLTAIQQMPYPHQTYLCDEGNDPELKAECERLGVHHVTREKKINAKAGNINNALQQAEGELCLILDPDHIPVPDMLDRLVPYFQDSQIGFVQSVQGYYNIYDNIISKGSAQQTFQFYGPMMMGMNSYGTAQAIGANCLFRRKALNSISGHAAGLAEDMNTSMHLHAKGWQSVYVPEMLTRGLVPNTLSGYYLQQLKWSRGVFELLVTSYPQFFSRFSWRQKIHYGLLPWHYFMGFVFLINFLIPIASLLGGVMPMQINFAYFLLILSPLLASVFLVRQYVQRWVMEEDERGIQIQGGLMAIGTWWVYILGFVFTLIRRKVPYIPTPKDGQDDDVLKLNLPNLALGALTTFAIGYGLYRDFNPYSLGMAGFASFNLGLIAFMLFIGWQNQWRRYKESRPPLRKIFFEIWRLKDAFWRFRRRAYWALRLSALPLLIGFFSLLFYFSRSQQIEQLEPQSTLQFSPSFLPGAGPLAQLNESSVSQLQKIDSRWGHWLRASPAAPAGLRQFSSQHYPLLWLGAKNLAPQSALARYDSILAGYFDPALALLAQSLEERGSPVFIMPLTAPELPAEAQAKEQLARKFGRAWRYVHKKLQGACVANAVWVLPPLAPEELARFFPGNQYTDWLSAYFPAHWGPLALAERYDSIARSAVYSYRLPLLALSEVHSPDLLDFARESNKLQALLPLSGEAGFPLAHFERPLCEAPRRAIPRCPEQGVAQSHPYYAQLKGLNYHKSSDWQASQHPLMRRVSDRDMAMIKDLGLGQIKRYGPGVYDHNVLRSAEAAGLEVIYAFWLGEITDFLGPDPKREALEASIVKTVTERRSEPSIKAWHLGSAQLQSLGRRYAKPDLLYQREAYLLWVNDLASKIKALDPLRPLSIELDHSAYLMENVDYIAHSAPMIDAVGVNFFSATDAKDLEQWPNAARSLFINRLAPGQKASPHTLAVGWLYAAWQDEVFATHVSFDGLLDREGYRKKDYWWLDQTDSLASFPLPEIRILRPAQRSFEGDLRWFRAYLRENESWLPASDSSPYRIRWTLVKVDAFGFPYGQKALGEGPEIRVETPAQGQSYRLRAELFADGYSASESVALSPAVYRGPYLEEWSAAESDYYFQN